MRLIRSTTPVGRPVLAELIPGNYLTNGDRLFRVVAQLTSASRPFAELEDCLTLEVHRYSPDELYGMQLRPVRTA